jgi:hypothetical protein
MDITMPPPKDPEKVADWKHRISERLKVVLKGRTPSKNTIEAARIANRKPKTEAHKKKISISLEGKTQSSETIQKRVGKNRGQKRTLETRQRMSASQKDRVVSQNTCEKLSLSHMGKNMGDKNPQWRGGISFEPYCQKFTKEFKERVREFFGRKCVECGTPETGEKLSVHHVTYDKKVCCNNTKPMFVCLCRTCHTKTNRNREYWRAHFTEMINVKYNGKSYVSKEEI